VVAYPGAVSDLALPEVVGALATELAGVPSARRRTGSVPSLVRRASVALNEKALVRRAGFDSLQSRAAAPGATATQLTATVDAVAAQLGVEPLTTR
jgi:hypothetical protein